MKLIQHMKTRDKILLTIGAIIALTGILLQELALYKTELFSSKIGIIAGIIIIAIGVVIWVIDPIMSIFKKK